MNDEKFSDEKYRPTFTDDRPRYRFEDYESDTAQRQYPMNPPPNYAAPQNFDANFERLKDEKHLDQLSLGFKIYAGVNALFSCFPFIHLFMGIMIVTGGMGGGKDAPPAFFGWFFIIFAAAIILLGWTISALNFFAGRFINERRNYTFCFVMSCINCAFMPFGTILGVFSLVVLLRGSVKDIFSKNSNANLPV